MVKSKFSNYAILGNLFGISILSISCIFLSLFEKEQGRIILRETPLPKLMLFLIGYCIFLLLLVIFVALKKFITISIDSENKTIKFKNAITRYTREYNFEYYDGYLDSFTTTSKTNYKVLFLIKNKKSIKKIEGYYYKNIDEMQKALSSMNYFGFNKNLGSINRRIFLNKPIVD